MSIMKSQNLYNYLNFNVTTKENEKKNGMLLDQATVVQKVDGTIQCNWFY